MNENLELHLDRICSDVEILTALFSSPSTPIADLDINDLPDLPGLYCVAGYWDTEYRSLDLLFYIGVSITSIRDRWRNHHKMGVFQAITYAANYGERYARERGTPVRLKKTKPHNADFLGIYSWTNPFSSSEFLLWLEKELIRRLNPPCNNLSVGRNKDSDFVTRSVDVVIPASLAPLDLNLISE